MNQVLTIAPVLTEDQQEAADKFFAFLMGPDKTFTLSGGAGVGKTFLTTHLCNAVMKQYELACALVDAKPEYDDIAFTATTNKAAEVLENSLGKPVQTIHSYLALRVKDDWATGRSTLIKTNSYKVRRRLIVFIDEASMVDTPLYQLILESFVDSKIVFIGDKAQMAPVGEPLSPVFQNVNPDNFVHLSKPVRNANSPALMALCAQLRETVETGVFRPIKLVPGSIEHLDDDQMQDKLTEVFKDPDPSSRILCYTNTRVEAFNDFIRTDVRGLPEDFQENDKLVVAQNFTGHSPGSTNKRSNQITLNVEREVVMASVGDVYETDAYGPTIQYRQCIVRTNNDLSSVVVRIPLRKQQVLDLGKKASAAKDWSVYFGLKEFFTDLRDKAACTVYKSQGSTYESVFVDLGNIGTSFDAVQVARMLFVAVSRATTKVYLYGDLPPAYIGKD